MQQLYLDGFIKGYARKAMYIQDITHHPYKHEIERGVKVLLFFDDYGAEATVRAFGVGRSTVYVWKQKLKTGNGRLSSLAPVSKRPRQLRISRDYSWHRQEILTLREQYPGLGKDKLQVLLNNQSKRVNQQTLSVSTVGRIVAKLQQQGQLPTRRQLTLSARTGRLTDKRVHRVKLKKARRGSFRPQQPGDLVQVDCVIKIIAGLRRYVISAVDYRSQFALAMVTKH